jgi:uncharacterized protein with NRDE domain
MGEIHWEESGMCLLLMAIRLHPRYKAIFAANRDEFYDRPTAQAAFWEESPHVLGGRDLKAGGTWMGITRSGRIAAITNYRDPSRYRPEAPSRGHLVTEYLKDHEAPLTCIRRWAQRWHQYNGFNLVLADRKALFWCSNQAAAERSLGPGIYGLSNHLLDTPWPKIEKGKAGLKKLIDENPDLDPEGIFTLLCDRQEAEEASLPDTGVGLQLERVLSPIFITSPGYGTRSSTILLVDHGNRVTFLERTFSPDSPHPDTVKYEFKIE